MQAIKAFRRDLLISGCVMAAGFIMMLLPNAVPLSFPSWWIRAASLLTVVGAVAELITIAKFSRRK
jgi:hypothetical protein